MLAHPAFSVDPWSLTESSLDLSVLPQTESVFTLSNGHIGLRGNLDEGEPYGLPGTYLNSVYELRPLPYAEAGFGNPESGQTVVNVTNGKIIRLLVNDEPLDVRYGELVHHRRTLDFRTGLMVREVEWRSPAGAGVRVVSTRLVSFVQRSVVAVRYEVTPVDREVQVVLQSELVANEALPARPSEDPRVSAILDQPLESEESYALGTEAMLVHRVRRSGLRLAAAMGHEIEGPTDRQTSIEAADDSARMTVLCTLKPSETLAVTKLLAYGWSAERSRPAIHDQVRGALSAGAHTGWKGLVDLQRQYLDEFWAGADVEIDGDPEVQQAVRFCIFHVLQAAARAERRPIPAKGLTGTGYEGHAFWDSEIYTLGLLSLSRPEAVADALRWRQSTLPSARDRAQQLGLKGAAFPWRTINGDECSAYWPAGTAAFHIGADIAHCVIRYVRVTGDDDFEANVGLELLVETARLWLSLGHHHADGTFRIDGVTGPDEYSAIADNNVYTNLMAQQNLQAAADACSRHPKHAVRLGVQTEEAAMWRDAAKDMYVPYDDRLQIHPQASGFTDHEIWNFDDTRADQYPLFLHFPYFDLYRKQVVKQADLVLAMHIRGEAFTLEQMSRNFPYYEMITVRDSSLSACSQAVMAAETGHLGLAYEYVGEAALVDIADLEHNTQDGLHMASLAGAWIALVEGLGGLRIEETRLGFCPRLPENLRTLRFRVTYRGRRLKVAIEGGQACYELLVGDSISIWHYGEEVALEPNEAECRPLPPRPNLPRPRQPPGREPVRGERRG